MRISFLPAVRMTLPFVMPGLDPGIQISGISHVSEGWLDCRDRPGNDKGRGFPHGLGRAAQ